MTDEIIQENSLYVDAASRATLVADPSKALDAFFLNYLGFLGLYAFSDTRGFMKTYETTEKKLMIDEIDDGNHDVSLSIKVIRDAGIIDDNKVRALTKLLFFIKTKKVRSKDLDDAKIREMIAATMLATKTCNAQVKNIVHAFLDGKLTLKAYAMAAYDLAKKPEFRDVTLELRNLVLKGQYGDFFTLARKAGGVTAAPGVAAAAPKVAAPVVVVPVKPVLKADVKARIQSYLDNVRSSSRNLQDITTAVVVLLTRDSVYSSISDELAAAYVAEIDPKYFETTPGTSLNGSFTTVKLAVTYNALFIKYFEAMVRTMAWDRFSWSNSNMPSGYDFYTPLLKAAKESVPPISAAACNVWNALGSRLRQVAGQNNANYATELAPLMNIKDKAHKAHLMGIIPPITHTSVWHTKVADMGSAAATWIRTWGAKMTPYVIILEGAKLPNSEVAKLSSMDQLKLALTEYKGDMAGFGVRFPNVGGSSMFRMFDDDSIDIYSVNPDLCEKGFVNIKNEPSSGNGTNVLAAMKRACALTLINRIMAGKAEVKDYWAGALGRELINNISWAYSFQKTRQRLMAWLGAMPVADSADYHKFEAAFNLVQDRRTGAFTAESLFKFNKATAPNAQGGVNSHSMQWLPVYAYDMHDGTQYGDGTFITNATAQNCVIDINKLGADAKDWLTKRGTSIGRFGITMVTMVTDPEAAKDIYLKAQFDVDTNEDTAAAIEASILASMRDGDGSGLRESFDRLCKPGKIPGMFKKWPNRYSHEGPRIAGGTYMLNYLNDVPRAKSLMSGLTSSRERMTNLLYYAKLDEANLTAYTVYMLSYMFDEGASFYSRPVSSQFAEVLDKVMTNPALAAEIETESSADRFYSTVVGYVASGSLTELVDLYDKATAAGNAGVVKAARKALLQRQEMAAWVRKSAENAAKYREMTGFQTDEVTAWLVKEPRLAHTLIEMVKVTNDARFGATPERVTEEGSKCWIIFSAFLDALSDDEMAAIVKACTAVVDTSRYSRLASIQVSSRLQSDITNTNMPFGDGQGRSKTELALIKWAVADQLEKLKTTVVSRDALASLLLSGKTFGVVDDKTCDELTANFFQKLIDAKYQVGDFRDGLTLFAGGKVKMGARTMQILVSKFATSESEIAQDALIEMGFADGGVLDPEFVKAVRAAKKETAVARRLTKVGGVSDVLQQMENDPNGVKIDLDPNRLVTFLRHNDIDLSFVGALKAAKAVKTFEDMLAQRKSDAASNVIPPLQLEEIKDPKVAVDRTAALFKANRFNHSPALGIVVKRVFKPTLKGNVEKFDAWVAANPGTTFMDLYHGTGTINAAFILRFGFKIIKSTDPSVTGRMLGDGIYFADNLNKSMLYMSNAGYIRDGGQEGYVIKCRVALGKKPANYRDGSSLGRTLVSNEWAVFSTDQIRVDEVYYGVSAEKDTLQKAMVVEASDEYSPNVSEFMFMDGQIPVSEDVLIDFAAFPDFGKHVWIETSAKGPIVCIRHDSTIAPKDSCYRWGQELQTQEKKADLKLFLSLLKNTY